jgi:predicted adenylyl cyclase CyaB
MATNIEIKARLTNPPRTRELAEQISSATMEKLEQRDTFFACNGGRLKLREFSVDHGELIFYRRENVGGTKQSDYLISHTDAPESLRSLLQEALGAKQVVTKTRLLYRVGQTRIHLDEVVGLGSFLELEVVLREGQSLAEGHEIARRLMDILEIERDQLIDCAYADLMEQKRTSIPNVGNDAGQ